MLAFQETTILPAPGEAGGEDVEEGAIRSASASTLQREADHFQVQLDEVLEPPTIRTMRKKQHRAAAVHLCPAMFRQVLEVKVGLRPLGPEVVLLGGVTKTRTGTTRTLLEGTQGQSWIMEVVATAMAARLDQDGGMTTMSTTTRTGVDGPQGHQVAEEGRDHRSMMTMLESNVCSFGA